MVATTYFIFGALHIAAAALHGIKAESGVDYFSAIMAAITGGLLLAAGLAL